MRSRRSLLCVLVAAVSIVALAPPARSAVPSNDTFLGATPVGLGFAEIIDVTEATSDADDADIVATCDLSLPEPTGPSVWYAFTTDVSGTVSVDTTAPGSFPLALVAIGPPGGFEGVACGGGEVIFDAVGGQTYVVAVVDFDPTGEPLSVRFDAAVPFALDVTVDGHGGYFIDGQAEIRGTYTCNTPLQSLLLDVLVVQQVGGTAIAGFENHSVPGDPVCDVTPQPWSVVVLPANGQFRGGHAEVTVGVEECAPQQCAPPDIHATVQLSRTGTGGPTPPVIEPEPDPVLPPVAIDADNDAASNPYALTTNQPVILDTTTATTEPADAVFEQTCLYGLNGAPAEPLPYLDNSVWFTFTAPAAGAYYVNTIGSDYLPFIASRSQLFGLTLCGTLAGPILAVKGQPVRIMVTDYFGGSGGQLQIVVQNHPVKLFGTRLSIDPVATFDAEGRATVSGTFSCFEPVPDAVTKIITKVELYQNTGRFREGVSQNKVLSTDPVCDGSLHPWSVVVDGTPFGVEFRGGKAEVRAIAETHAPPAGFETQEYGAFVHLAGPSGTSP